MITAEDRWMLLTATWFFQNFNSIVYSFELFISSIFTLSWFVFQNNTCSFEMIFIFLDHLWRQSGIVNFTLFTFETLLHWHQSHLVDILSNFNLDINENPYYLSDLMHVLSGRKSRIDWLIDWLNWIYVHFSDLRKSWMFR